MAGVCPKNVQHPNSQASPEYQMHQPTKLPNTKSLNVDNVDNNNDDDNDPKPPQIIKFTNPQKSQTQIAKSLLDVEMRMMM